jgi:PEP-CTERM motif
MKKLSLMGLVSACAFCLTSHAATILYQQNFENPNSGTFVNDGGDVNIFNSVNTLYGGQPAGFLFAQQFTVETLLVGGSQAHGTGFLDPQNRAGRHVLGMLSAVQNDLLALSFNVGANRFLNFQLDISSIDLSTFGGPFVPVGGLAPIFRLSLFDNPGGGVGLGSGTLLDSADITGTAAPLRNTFDWTNHIVALDATGTVNGNVILRIDELQGGYAALDNFVIAASDNPGDVGGGQVPEPSVLGLLALGLAGLGYSRRKQTR